MNTIGTISIIMAAFNAEKTIAQSIESVINQTYSDWELIIVNDCSVDKTLTIANGFADKDARIRVFSNPVNSGISKTRRVCIDNSKGTWIAILDSDDLWLADKLEKQVDTAFCTGADLIFTGSSFIDENGDFYDWVLHVPKTTTYRKLRYQNIISNSSSLVRKDVFLANCVDRDDIHEDFACWLNILKHGGKVVGIDEPLLQYRISHHSRTGNKCKSALRNWRTYRSIGMGLSEALISQTIYMIKGFLKYKRIKG